MPKLKYITPKEVKKIFPYDSGTRCGYYLDNQIFIVKEYCFHPLVIFETIFHELGHHILRTLRFGDLANYIYDLLTWNIIIFEKIWSFYVKYLKTGYALYYNHHHKKMTRLAIYRIRDYQSQQRLLHRK